MASATEPLTTRKIRAPKWSSLRDAVRTIFEADPIDRVSIIRAGVPAIFVLTMTKDMGLAKERFYVMTGLARATVDRKVARRDVLSRSESERVVGFAELVGQVENMVRESGTAEQFDGPRWIATWLERAHPALGGRKPGDLMDTAEGTDTPDYGADDQSGKGAEKTGGRWNREGTPALYTSLSRALACLETLVHLGGSAPLPLNRYLVEITIQPAAWKTRRTFDRVDPANVGWDAEPAGLISIEWGTAWLDSNASLVAVVPSIIVPEEENVLLNPRHPDGNKLRFAKQRKWTYDLRLG